MTKRLALLLASLLLTTACSAGNDNAAPAAAPAPWVEGTHYFRIDPAQPAANDGKVEVVEVFSYACPHCAHFAPYVDRLVADLPKGVTFRMIPATFSPMWEPYARAFYAADALGLAQASHDAVFQAIWQAQSIPPQGATLDNFASFYAGRYMVAPQRFLEIAQSSQTDARLIADVKREQAWGIDGTPSMVVDGKYRADAGSAGGSFEKLVELTQWLVQRELDSKKRSN